MKLGSSQSCPTISTSEWKKQVERECEIGILSFEEEILEKTHFNLLFNESRLAFLIFFLRKGRFHLPLVEYVVKGLSLL